MAVAYDTATGGENSINHTASGANRLAVLALSWFGGVTVTGVTYGGNAMTLVGQLEHPDNSNLHMALAYYVAPATSSQAVTPTYSGSAILSYLQVATFTGVDQGTPISGGAVTSNSGASQTNIAPSVDSVTANDLMFGAGYGGGPPASIGAGTSRLLANDWGGNGLWNGLATNAGTGTVSVDWTHGDNRALACAARIIAVSTGSSSIAAISSGYHQRGMR